MESLEHIESELRNSNNFETQNEIRREKFEIVNKVGIIYAIGAAIKYQFGQILTTIFRKYFSIFLEKNKGDAILLGTLIINQIFGTLLMFLLTKFIKKTEIRRHKYGYKKYLANLCINCGLLIIGSIIGYLINFGFYYVFTKNSTENKSDSILNEMLLKSNIFLTLFVVCFTGPIAEEFIFRKFLIDRLSIYSKTLAIFSSGIMFGIFHGNIHQFFGTTFMGWALAYSYAETGNIFIPISYHIIENSITTITQINNPFQNKMDNIKIKDKIIILIFLLRLIEGIIGIIFLIVYRKKIKVTGEENKSKDKWVLFKSYGMWIFFLEGFILFTIFYSDALFGLIITELYFKLY